MRRKGPACIENGATRATPTSRVHHARTARAARDVLLGVAALLGSGRQADAQLESLPSLRLAEELRVGGPTLELERFAAAKIGPRGQILIPQPGAKRLVAFDSVGRRLWISDAIGTIAKFGWVGDTAWVSEIGGERVIFLGPTGRRIRAITLDDARPSRADAARIPVLHFILGPEAVYSDGTMLAVGGADARDPLVLDSIYQGQRFVGVRDRVIQRVVARPPLNANSITYKVPGKFVWCGSSVPFGNRSAWAVSGDGTLIAAASADITSGAGGTIRISVFRPSGDTIVAANLPFDGIPIDPLVAERELARRAAEIERLTNSPCGPEQLVHYRQEAPKLIPPAHPPIQDVRIGNDGTVWLRINARGWSGWLMLDQQGGPIGRVTAPGAFILVDGSRSHLWAIEGGTSLVRYRIEGGAPGAAAQAPCPRPAARSWPPGATVKVGEPAVLPCKLELVETGVVLRGDGADIPDPGDFAAILGNGGFLTTAATSTPGILLWSSNGTFVRRITKAVAGVRPEFAAFEVFIFIDHAERVHVLHGAGNWTILDQKLSVTSDDPRLPMKADEYLSTITGDGTFVSAIAGAEHWFHVLAPSDTVATTFGDYLAAGQISSNGPSSHNRLIGYGGSDRFWATSEPGSRAGYTLDLFTVRGERVLTVERGTPWFPPGSGEQPVRGRPPPPILYAPNADTTGLLLTMTALGRSLDPAISGAPAGSSWDVLTYLEVIDTRSGTLLASTTMPGAPPELVLGMFSSHMTGYRRATGADGRRELRIVELRLSKQN